MKKYHETYEKQEIVDLKDIDYSQLCFEDRYWLLATKAIEYYNANNRFLAVLCLTRIKELTFVWFCINRVDQCGFLRPKYQAYVGDFEFQPSTPLLVQIDNELNNNRKIKMRYNIITAIVMVLAIALIIILYTVAGLNIIPSLLIGVLASLIVNYVILPLIMKARKGKEKPETLTGEVPEKLKELINYDEVANDILKEEDYKPLIFAHNEQELNEAIRNYQKK